MLTSDMPPPCEATPHGYWNCEVVQRDEGGAALRVILGKTRQAHFCLVMPKGEGSAPKRAARRGTCL